MKMKLFYFKNRNELKNFVNTLKEEFLNKDGEFIYFIEENKMLIMYNGEMDGGYDSYIIESLEEVPEILRKINFKTFAVRSKRRRKMEDNRILGQIIKEKLGKDVNLDNPDITIYLENVGKFNVIFIK
ncbi:MAG: THUMP domain-containing protein [Thermoplasmata archaeon]